MSESTTAEPECSLQSVVHGKRLLPTWIDQLGRETPEKPWALMPRSTDLNLASTSINIVISLLLLTRSLGGLSRLSVEAALSRQ